VDVGVRPAVEAERGDGAGGQQRQGGAGAETDGLNVDSQRACAPTQSMVRRAFRAGVCDLSGISSNVRPSSCRPVFFLRVPNWTPPDLRLNELWATAEEVQTPRGILLGGAQPGVQPADSLAAFHRLCPGKSADIEQVISHDWSKDAYAGMCERIAYKAGERARYWPEVTRPVGRIHFAGAYAAAMSWGQEAALESGNRAAMEIDRA
jgi:Flavin containing amine oxidoreductase